MCLVRVWCSQTLAFLVPLLVRLAAVRATKGDKVLLVVSPTRELAVQTAAVCTRLLEGSEMNCLALIGGANVNRQLENLKKKRPAVLVNTLEVLGRSVEFIDLLWWAFRVGGNRGTFGGTCCKPR